MSDIPFGFGSPERGDGEDRGGQDPFGMAFGPMGAMGQADLGAAFQRLGQLFSWTGGPVNWDLARDVARQAVSAGGDRSTGAVERREAEDAVRLGEVWLDAGTTLPAATTTAVAWSRAEWVEATLPSWRELVEPVAGRVVEAMGSAISQGPGDMAGIAAMAGQLEGMMRSLGGAMFGAQVGQALAGLAGEVVGSTDVGIPLGPAGRAVLVPANVTAFGEGLEVPADQVRIYLALREAAHHRLFAHVPWLRGRVVAEVEAYARGITIDPDRISSAVAQIDPTDPAALQEAMSGGLFEPQDTPEQQQALARLETLLALVEGWVDDVVDQAARAHLPSAAALRETLRRRRATGGPAEATFASLVGLELRPRRLRDAAALWGATSAERGVDGRDAVWAHPDLLPTADDLDDPIGFARGKAALLDLSSLEAPTQDGQVADAPERGPDADSGGTDRPDGGTPGDPDR